jgi:DNA repair exonuclease SbcCD ATPase subunit
MILSLMIENFLPFRERVTLPLANRGLVLVNGENRVSAAASGNGVGKTSLAHAICWGLFGVDLAWRRADAVCNRFTTGQTVVRLDMDDALGPWSVTRTRRPHGLSVTGIDGVLENEDMAVLQEKIEQRLGFGLQTFLNAVVFGQGAFDRFSKASQDEQVRMLDEIQGVDFSDSLRRAIDWRKALSSKSDETTRALAAAKTQQAAHEQSVVDQRAAHDRFAEEQAARIAELTGKVDGLAAAVVAAESLLGHARATAGRIPALELILAELAAGERAAAACQVQADGARRDWHQVVGEVASLEAELRAVEALPTCPTCLQDVQANKAALKRVRERYGVLIADAADHVAQLGKAKAASDRDLSESSRERAEVFARLDAATQDRPRGEQPGRFVAMLAGQVTPAQVQQREAAVAAAQLALDAHGVAVTEEWGRSWTGSVALAQAEAAALAARTQAGVHEAQLRRLTEAAAIAEYWVEAFGDRGIRSLLVDAVAGFMNERIAYHLETLAAGEATCVMSATTPTKKGTVRERISFATTWTWGAKDTDGSGGQDRRRDLAVFAAAQDLAESRSARPFPIKIFDEPGDSLDSRGKELFAEWVRLQARDRTTLLVTHDQELAGYVEADAVLTVVMDAGGARIES